MIPGITETFPEYATLHQATLSMEEMGSRTITTRVKIDGDIVPDFINQTWELEYNGEKFVLSSHTPQAVKDDTSRCSIIDLTFESEVIHQLKRYFYIKIYEVEADTPVIDRFVCPLRMTCADFIHAFNDVLKYYYGDAIHIEAAPGVALPDDVRDIDINYTYLWDALQIFYNVFEMTWKIEPRGLSTRILIGAAAQSVGGHVFRYGYSGGLRKVERQIQDAEIYNVLFGRGGTKNLPYRYFKKVDENNPAFAGDPDACAELENIYFDRLLDINFRYYVKGWLRNPRRNPTADYPFPSTPEPQDVQEHWAYQKGLTDERFDPVEYVADSESIAEYGRRHGKLDDNDDIYPTIQGIDIEGDSPDVGRVDEIVAVGEITDGDDSGAVEGIKEEILFNGSRVTGVATNYNPSGVYDTEPRRKVSVLSNLFHIDKGFFGRIEAAPYMSASEGGERITREGYSVFAVSSTDGKEYAAESYIPGGDDYTLKVITEISILDPTRKYRCIVGLNSDIRLISSRLSGSGDAGYVGNTFDIWVKNIWETSKLQDESDIEYANRVWGPIFGDRYGNEAKVVFSSGAMTASSDWEFVIADIPTYDTSKSRNGVASHWRISLGKSDAEMEATGKWIPNAQSAKPVAGDYFFFIGIDMPHNYVEWAEKRVNASKIAALNSRAYANPTWVVQLDGVRINTLEGQESVPLITQLGVGKAITIADPRFTNDKELTFVIRTMNITWSESTVMKPEVSIVLSENVLAKAGSSKTLSPAEIQARIEQAALSSVRRMSFASATSREYLSKQQPDTAYGQMHFPSGATFGNFLSGLNGSGAAIDEMGHGEFDSLTIRKFLEVPELRYNRVDVQVGNYWRAPGGGLIDHVEPDLVVHGTGTIFLKLEEGEVASVAVGDICTGIFHNEAGNASQDGDDSKGNFHFAGFSTCYFRITEMLAADGSIFKYAIRETSARWTESHHPQAAMTFVCYGNTNDTTRQVSRYSTRTYERYLKGVNDWEITASNIAAQFGDLSNLTQLNDQTHDFSGMSGYSAYLENIYMSGYIKQTANLPTPVVEFDTGGKTAIIEGSDLTLTAKVKQGWDDLTSQVTAWQIVRNSGDDQQDAVWAQDQRVTTFNGSITLTDTDIPDYNHYPLFRVYATVNGTTYSGVIAIPLLENGESGQPGAPGYNNATVYLYKRGTNISGVGINSTLYYKFSDPKKLYTNATATVEATTQLNDWQLTIPAGSDPLYVTAAVISSRSDIDDVGSNEWATPVIMSEHGVNSAAVFLYKRVASAPTEVGITADLYYNFADGELYTDSTLQTKATSALKRWQTTIPSGSSPCYVTQASALSPNAYDKIEPEEWAYPRKLVENGADGADGRSTATIYLYKRSAASVDAVGIPNTLYYKFSDNKLYYRLNGAEHEAIDGGYQLGGWYTYVQGGSSTCYITQVTVSSDQAYATIEAGLWGTPRVFVTNGISGESGAVIYLYKRSADPAAVASVGIPIDLYFSFSTPRTLYSSATQDTEATPEQLNYWSMDIPVGDDPIYVTAILALSRTGRATLDNNNWATPARMAENGTDGEDGLSSAVVTLYQRGTTAPAKPSATLTYTFATGVLSGTGGNPLAGWSQTIPSSNNGLPCWAIQAVALSDGATDTIPSGEWSEQSKILEDGQDGADGEDSVMLVLDNYSDSITYDSEGTKIGDSVAVNAKLMKGGKELSGIPFNWTPSTGVTRISSGVRNARLSITNISTGSGTVTAEAAYNGVNAVPVFLYKRYSTTPVKGIDKTLYYKFSDGNYYVKDGNTYTLANENTDLALWQKSIPEASGDRACYMMQAAAISTDDYAEIPYTSWTDPRAINEEDAEDGKVGALVILYKRSASTLSAAGITSTRYYKYSTPDTIYSNAACTLPVTSGTNGWYITVPDGTNQLYITAAVVSSTADTASESITTSEWATPIKIKESITYSAVFAIKKTTFIDQYEIEATPKSVSYNSTTGTKSAGSISFVIYRTKHAADGTVSREAVTTLDSTKYKLYRDGVNVTSSYSGSYSYTLPSPLPASVILTLNRLNGENPETLLARAQVPILSVANGETGPVGITYRRSVWDSGKQYRNDSAGPGQDGLRIIDIVYNKNIALLSDSTLHIYQCRTSHTSSSANNPDEHHDGQNDVWDSINQFAPVATPLLLVNQIMADYIDVTDLAANTGFINALTVNKLTVKSGNNIIAKMGDMDPYDGTVYPFWIGGSLPTDASTKFRVDSAGNITATGGSIGGFNIANNHLGVASSETNGMALFSEYISFYKSTTATGRSETFKAIIGTNALPSTTGSRALAEFVNEVTSTSLVVGASYGIRCSVKGYNENYAFYCENGQFAGLRPKVEYYSTGPQTLTEMDFTVVVNNSSTLTLNLPSTPRDGQMYFIHHLSTSTLTLSSSGPQIYRVDTHDHASSHSRTRRELAIVTFSASLGYWILHLLYI